MKDAPTQDAAICLPHGAQPLRTIQKEQLAGRGHCRRAPGALRAHAPRVLSAPELPA